jgi:uncharacterized protein YegJ (DUF2314 family)
MRNFPPIFILVIAALGPARAHAQSPSGRLAPNAPVDRPVTATARCQWTALVKAVEPYAAKARASYPDARRRFLDRSLPRRSMFVTTRLHDASGHDEQVFVAVDSIVGSKIHGTLASEIGVVQGYRYGQPYSLSEDDLVDWMFANPDGTEEGNVVGKFMDTYVPPRTCRDA